MYGTGTSTTSGAVNDVFLFMVVVSVILLLVVTALMIYFSVKYRRSRRPKADQIEGSLPLEILWTIIPTVIVLFMFYFGFEGFKTLRDVPEDAMTVKVTGRMWDWSFTYENGKKSNTLFVPVDRPIKLAMTSLDVIHSFFIPAFRIKEDVVPGRETYLWFRPQTTGPADVFCAEYCGQSHAYMMSEVLVMNEEDFQQWYADTTDVPQGRSGPGLLGEQGCLGCHSLDGREDIGPTFKGLFGSERTVIRDEEETTVTADEEYLRRAIVDPSEEIVKGFYNVMPQARNIADEDLQAMIDYIKTLE
ncbi:MAG: cytochrome c oxidase subunit II [Candidatus Eisenbacteria bacterium]|nr:cytochrome c oxidase subunit II [Candidatus Eisenbacteria bacterium]